MDEVMARVGGGRRQAAQDSDSKKGKEDRTLLLCFDASREGFLWLSRYVCFPFLLLVEFTSLATSWHYIFVPWQIFDDTMLLLFVAAIHGLAILVLWLLFKTSRTSPGYVPLSWEPSGELVESGKFMESSSRDITSRNWCSKCQSHRPNRAHHCRYCQRCVLVFDHHCPWVNNCVGWGNIKYFMLLLFYATFYGGLICFSFLVRCYEVIWASPEAVTTMTKLVLVGLLGTWVSFAFGVVSLAQAMMVQIVYLTPSCEKANTRKRIQQTLKIPRLDRLAFLRENIKLVFGRNTALWYIPTPPDSDPFNYPSFTDTFFLDDEVPPPEHENGSEDPRAAANGTDHDGEDSGSGVDGWKAKEATSEAFDPAYFYGQLPRKGG